MENKYTGYCVKCKEKVEISEPERIELKSSRGIRQAVKGNCNKCGTKVFAILKNDGTQN